VAYKEIAGDAGGDTYPALQARQEAALFLSGVAIALNGHGTPPTRAIPDAAHGYYSRGRFVRIEALAAEALRGDSKSPLGAPSASSAFFISFGARAELALGDPRRDTKTSG
jgi:hypothetical protein